MTRFFDFENSIVKATKETQETVSKAFRESMKESIEAMHANDAVSYAASTSGIYLSRVPDNAETITITGDDRIQQTIWKTSPGGYHVQTNPTPWKKAIVDPATFVWPMLPEVKEEIDALYVEEIALAQKEYAKELRDIEYDYAKAKARLQQEHLQRMEDAEKAKFERAKDHDQVVWIELND